MGQTTLLQRIPATLLIAAILYGPLWGFCYALNINAGFFTLASLAGLLAILFNLPLKKNGQPLAVQTTTFNLGGLALVIGIVWLFIAVAIKISSKTGQWAPAYLSLTIALVRFAASVVLGMLFGFLRNLFAKPKPTAVSTRPATQPARVAHSTPSPLGREKFRKKGSRYILAGVLALGVLVWALTGFSLASTLGMAIVIALLAGLSWFGEKYKDRIALWHRPLG